MKKIFIVLIVLHSSIAIYSQSCTTNGFDNCSGGSSVAANFNNSRFTNNNANPILFSGSALSIGARYKFEDVAMIGAQTIDALITIDDISNAILHNIDDDAAVNETNTSRTQSALFAPLISPDALLTCANRNGYVQFTVTFYPSFTTTNPSNLPSPLNILNLNYLYFDMDGHTVGSNGWLKEIGYVKRVNMDVPINIGSQGTELTNAGVFTDNGGDWLLTLGTNNEKSGVARCAEAIEKTFYSSVQTAFTFRMGYTYKAPVPCLNTNEGQLARQYGSKFSCFSLPSGGPLPVSLTNLGVNYNSGIITLNWTSLQEHNLIRYEIQRSIDGLNFEYIGYVTATNLSTVQQYKFTDNVTSVNAKYLFYRIRIVDVDNSLKLTNVVSVKIAGWKSNEMTITPNPVYTDAQMTVKTIKATSGNIAIIDASGKIVLQQQVQLLRGNNTIAMNSFSKLSVGYYTVRLVTSDDTFSSKLLIGK